VIDNKNQPIAKAIFSLADIVREKIARLQEPKPEAVGRK
jgi:hypothetical protein